MKFIGSAEEYLHLETIDSSNCELLDRSRQSDLTILWFEDDSNQLLIDGTINTFNKNEIVFLTEFHNISPQYINTIRFLRFNRNFYCILDNDSEVSCKGLLFLGSSRLPLVSIPEDDIEKFNTLWTMFIIEMGSEDNLQIEMLQMMLKRYLILCTRLYKEQVHDSLQSSESDLIREFNFLVEQNFRSLHSVSDYADILNRSPKTLSNLFSKLGVKSPLQIIHERILLEARRMLRYSDLQVKQVGYELGFDDVQAFSRFFRNHEGYSPSEFKSRSQTGTIVNS